MYNLYDNLIKLAILPILKGFEAALNKDLLLESEKSNYYFQFDANELVKGDILKRFQAYELAIKNGIYQVDEVKIKEKVEPLGLNFNKLELEDILYTSYT